MEKDLNLNEIPAGSLVTEHRLVERYLQLMKRETIRIDRGKSPDRVLTERIIDFFKTYAHRCHYGKEEEILFHRLYSKRLSPEHKRVIDELVLEHIRERELIDRLEIAKDKFWLGDSGALSEILTTLKGILKFYPGHMQREEKDFFPAGMEYFSMAEQRDMLQDFAKFDQFLIHEKYIRMADQYEGLVPPSEYGNLTIQRILQPEVSGLPDDLQEEKKGSSPK